MIDSLRTNPAESERIGLNLDLVAKLTKDVVNPKLTVVSSADGAKLAMESGESDIGGEIYLASGRFTRCNGHSPASGAWLAASLARYSL